jgi:hypothetical protein
MILNISSKPRRQRHLLIISTLLKATRISSRRVQIVDTIVENISIEALINGNHNAIRVGLREIFEQSQKRSVLKVILDKVLRKHENNPFSRAENTLAIAADLLGARSTGEREFLDAISRIVAHYLAHELLVHPGLIEPVEAQRYVVRLAAEKRPVVGPHTRTHEET